MHICKFVACSIILCSLTITNAADKLWGRVTDEKGVAIKGAILSLDSALQTDTTDVDGKYEFLPVKQSSVRHQLKNSAIQNFVFGKNMVQFTITQRTVVTLGVYDLTGKLVKSILNEVLSPKPYSISVSGQGLASAAYVLTMHIGADHFMQQMFVYDANTVQFGTTENQSVVANVGTSAKTMAEIDRLTCTAFQYLTQDTGISSYNMEVNFKMVFVDRTPPVITFTKDDTAMVPIGNQAKFKSYWERATFFIKVTDNVSDSSNIILVAPTQTSIDTTVPGLHWIQYSAIDEAYNKGSASRLLSIYDSTITDKVPPVITLIGKDTVKLSQGQIYTDLGVTVKDAIDTLVDFSYFVNMTFVPPLVPSDGSNTYHTEGVTGNVVQTYRVMDTHKNIGTKTRIIQVTK